MRYWRQPLLRLPSGAPYSCGGHGDAFPGVALLRLRSDRRRRRRADARGAARDRLEERVERPGCRRRLDRHGACAGAMSRRSAGVLPTATPAAGVAKPVDVLTKAAPAASAARHPRPSLRR